MSKTFDINDTSKWLWGFNNGKGDVYNGWNEKEQEYKKAFEVIGKRYGIEFSAPHLLPCDNGEVRWLDMTVESQMGWRFVVHFNVGDGEIGAIGDALYANSESFNHAKLSAMYDYPEYYQGKTCWQGKEGITTHYELVYEGEPYGFEDPDPNNWCWEDEPTDKQELDLTEMCDRVHMCCADIHEYCNDRKWLALDPATGKVTNVSKLKDESIKRDNPEVWAEFERVRNIFRRETEEIRQKYGDKYRFEKYHDSQDPGNSWKM